MSKLQQTGLRTAAALLVLSAGLLSTQAQGGTIVQCEGASVCSSGFSVTKNGNEMGGGEFLYDAASGTITLNTDANSITGGGSVVDGGIVWDMGDGSAFQVDWLSGNADPVLDFGLGASTGANGSTFGFTFDLPIALQGPINANSSVSYTLTSSTSAGAQITPIGNNVVSAFEVDTSVGGLGSLNKGVDVGDTFFIPAGAPAQTQNSPVYTASNTFTGNLAYDLMNVQVDFSLSANSSVGISGFVEQTPVPVPAAVWLFGSGLLGLAAVARRRAS